jgi:inactivated superfamily I helicase
MKVPDPQDTPRLYTIPPSAPFLTTLARALLSGDLPLPGGTKPDPLTLPLTTIYLPTRRAARGLREAFLVESGGKALLLPRIHALGHADEDAALIFGAEDMEDADGAFGRPSIGPLQRRLALMRLILAWSQLPSPGATEAEIESIRWANSPGQASSLAADLARLMDFVETEEVDFSSLDTLVPEDLASHWEATIQFLKIVTEHWPEYLADNGLVSPVTRRNLLMAQETERIALRCRTARSYCPVSIFASTTRAGRAWPTIPSIHRRGWPSCCASLASPAATSLASSGAHPTDRRGHGSIS